VRDDRHLLLQPAVYMCGQQQLLDLFHAHVHRIDLYVQLLVLVQHVFDECCLLVRVELPVVEVLVTALDLLRFLLDRARQFPVIISQVLTV